MKIRPTIKNYPHSRRASLVIGGIINTSLGFGFRRPNLPKVTSILVEDSIKSTINLKARRISPRRIPSQFLANSAQKSFRQVKAHV